GCAFPLGANGAPLACGAPRRPGSSFCPEHHALCHLPPGGRAERRALAEEEALARAVGGRLGREAREPPDALLRRLDRISRLFFCPKVHVMFREERCPAELRSGPTPNGRTSQIQPGLRNSAQRRSASSTARSRSCRAQLPTASAACR